MRHGNTSGALEIFTPVISRAASAAKPDFAYAPRMPRAQTKVDGQQATHRAHEIVPMLPA